MARIPAGDITNIHYNFVVGKPLVVIKIAAQLRHILVMSKENECSFKTTKSLNIDIDAGLKIYLSK